MLPSLPPLRRLTLLSAVALVIAACESGTGSTTTKPDVAIDIAPDGVDIAADSFGSDDDGSTGDTLVGDAATDAVGAELPPEDAGSDADAGQTDVAVNVAPTVVVTAPPAGQVISVGQNVLISLAITDPDDDKFDLSVAIAGAGAPVYTEKAVGKSPSWTFTPSIPGAAQLVITVRDASGAEGSTTFAALVNTVPGAPVVAITPAAPTVADALTASIVVPAADPDPGALTYSYEWLIDGLPSEVTGATLPAGSAVKGQKVTVRVRAADPLAAGPAGEAQTLILNSAPIPPSFGLIPAEPVMATTAQLTCAVLSPATDLDLADTVTCTTAWVVDGAIDVSATSAAVGLASLRDASGKPVHPGSQVVCQVSCSDGTAVVLASSATAVVSEGNVCAGSWNNCSPDATCTGNGSFFPDCACKTGFTGDGKTCADVEECELLLFSCDANATCNNTIGSYTCSCNAGYEGDGKVCADIDECSTNTSNCAVEGGVCTNTDGSFSCACDTGFSGDGLSCADIDECLAPTTGLNLALSATATVAWGFDNWDDSVGWSLSTWPGDGTELQVLRYGSPKTGNYDNAGRNAGVALSDAITVTDALAAQPLALHVRAMFDVEGGSEYDRTYLVAVIDGAPYILLHPGAAPQNSGPVEAKLGGPVLPPVVWTGFPYPLAADATKLTADSEFHDYVVQLPALATTTTLQLRWEFDTIDAEANETTGVVVSQMTLSSLPGGCGTHAECVNLPGSATCTCDGVSEGNGKVCEDFNDCLTDNGGCGDPMQWACINLPFSAATCTDNNECDPDPEAGEVAPCDPAATCENTWGGFACTCPSQGYTGDGFVCNDINECDQLEALQLPGCVTNAVCVNQPGSYTCECGEGWSGSGFELCYDTDECAGPSEDTLADWLLLAPGEEWSVEGTSDEVRWRVHADGSLRYSNAAETNFDDGGQKNSGVISRFLMPPSEAFGPNDLILQVGCVIATESDVQYDKFRILVEQGASSWVFTKGIDFVATGNEQHFSLPLTGLPNSNGPIKLSLEFDTTDSIANDAPGIHVSELKLAVNYNGKCSWRTTCENTVGSYTCGKCPEGFLGDGHTCTDIDECERGVVVCEAANQQCYNTSGSAYCDCAPGYEQESEGGACVDTLECASNNGGCGEIGFVTCLEQEGAAPVCVDVEECATENGGCGDPSLVTCVEQYGAWPNCVDTDECEVDNGGCGDLVTTTCSNEYAALPSCSPRDQCALSVSILDLPVGTGASSELVGWRLASDGRRIYDNGAGSYATDGPNSGAIFFQGTYLPQSIAGGDVLLLIEGTFDIDPTAGDLVESLVAVGKGDYEKVAMESLEIDGKPYLAVNLTAFAGEFVSYQFRFSTVTDASDRTGSGIQLTSIRAVATVAGTVSNWCGNKGICEDTEAGFSCSCQQGFVWTGDGCLLMGVE